jgi:HEAT repeat protein
MPDYDEPMSIEQVVTEMGDGDKSLLNSVVMNLSDLNAEELEAFQQAWHITESKRRQEIMHRLAELAENNFELNFDNIFKSCLKDQDVEVRCKAIEGLWENEEPSLLKVLINLLKQDKSEKVQATAASALSKFAMLAELRKLSPHHASKVENTLLGILNNSSTSVGVRRRALEAAAPLSLPEVKKAITEAYQSHITSLKISSIYAMGQNCDPSWLPILLKELTNTDAEMRYEAVGACGELGEEEAIPDVIRLINDPDTEVRLAAIRALGRIGGTEAKECLQSCLRNSDETLRQAAEQALHKLEAEEDPLSLGSS